MLQQVLDYENEKNRAWNTMVETTKNSTELQAIKWAT